jgi:hypothetical protein
MQIKICQDTCHRKYVFLLLEPVQGFVIIFCLYIDMVLTLVLEACVLPNT